jgi:hypothetical protein
MGSFYMLSPMALEMLVVCNLTVIHPPVPAQYLKPFIPPPYLGYVFTSYISGGSFIKLPKCKKEHITH